MDLKLYGFGFYLFRWIYLFIYSYGFELGHGFGSIFVNFQQIPSMIGTFRGIIISFNLQNGFGFHLDLDLRRIIHGLGFVFEILNGFGYGLGLQNFWIWIGFGCKCFWDIPLRNQFWHLPKSLVSLRACNARKIDPVCPSSECAQEHPVLNNDSQNGQTI